jgi:hypothetical protein
MKGEAVLEGGESHTLRKAGPWPNTEEEEEEEEEEGIAQVL